MPPFYNWIRVHPTDLMLTGSSAKILLPKKDSLIGTGVGLQHVVGELLSSTMGPGGTLGGLICTWVGKFGQNTPYAESRTLLSVSTRLVLKACKGTTERLLGGRTHTINFSFHSNPSSSLMLLSAAELAIRGPVAT